jgi:hypothetical protein
MPRFRLLLSLVAFTALVAGCSKKTESATGDGEPSRGAPVWDNDRLQGVWAVESVLADPPAEAPRPEDMRYRFHDDRLSVEDRGRVLERYTVVVKGEEEPPVLSLTRANEKWEAVRIQVSAKEFRTPENLEWPYKFDGDKLILAVTTEPGEPATDFKPRKWVHATPGKQGVPAVVVLTLTKTAEAPAR